jgi:hypothetical protein
MHDLQSRQLRLESAPRRVCRVMFSSLAILIESGCAHAASPPALEPPATQSADASPVVTLKSGETVALERERLQLTLESVTQDSRCPKGETCIWEGDAVLRIWVEPAGSAKQPLDLHVTLARQRPVAVAGWYFQVEALAPYPLSGQRIAPGDYIATIRMTRTPPADGGLR